MSVFKRQRGGVESKTYSYKFTWKNQQILRKTPFTNREQAERAEATHLEALQKGMYDVANQLRHRETHTATIDDIIKVYRDHAGALNPATVTNNITALKSILRRVHGDNIDPGKMSAGSLNERLIHDYQREMLKATATNRLAHNTAKTTLSSNLRQARSLFSNKRIAIYKQLDLPDLTGFLRTHVDQPDKTRFKAPDTNLVNRTFTEALNLKKTDPRAYKAFLCAIGLGLRRKEIVYAQYTWFKHVPLPLPETMHGPPMHRIIMTVEINEEFAPKGREERRVPVEQHIHNELMALHIAAINTPEYILEGSKSQRYQTFRRLNKWLFDLGWTTRKKTHQLRKLYGAMVATQHGIYAAQKLLGHKDPRLTSDTYADLVTLPTIKIFQAA